MSIDDIEIKKSDEVIKNLIFGRNLRLKNKEAFFLARKAYLENPNIQYDADIIIKDAGGNVISGHKKSKIDQINVFLN